jgi:hypothetical protein
VTYETQNPPVAGLGFAAIRDLSSAMKYKPDNLVKAQYVYVTCESQTGRAQRQLIYDGGTALLELLSFSFSVMWFAI